MVNSMKPRAKDQISSYYAMCAPGMRWLILLNIFTMGGIVMAFKNFKPGFGIFR